MYPWEPTRDTLTLAHHSQGIVATAGAGVCSAAIVAYVVASLSETVNTAVPAETNSNSRKPITNLSMRSPRAIEQSLLRLLKFSLGRREAAERSDYLSPGSF